MNRHLLQRQMGFHSRPIILPKYEQIKVQKQHEESHRIKEEVDFSNGLNKLCYALLKGIPEPSNQVELKVKDESTIKPSEPLESPESSKKPSLIIPSIKDKATKTSSQIKIDIEKKKIDDKDAELLQEVLNKKPEKPGERLLKKLVKKHVKKKIPSHIKKKVEKIRAIEAKEHIEESQNNKIINAIKSAYE